MFLLTAAVLTYEQCVQNQVRTLCRVTLFIYVAHSWGLSSSDTFSATVNTPLGVDEERRIIIALFRRLASYVQLVHEDLMCERGLSEKMFIGSSQNGLFN